MASKSVAVVICSTRPDRLNPFVAGFVLDKIMENRRHNEVPVKVELLDLASQMLPLYDEPMVPSGLPADDPTPYYAHSHTRTWSARVRHFDAFIFVTPQYNWSIPAGLKNALDYLFHEWKGKPVGIVTYGHRGGVKAASHLRQILEGLRMGEVAEPTVALRLIKGISDGAEAAASMRDSWVGEGEGDKISTMFERILKLL